MDGWLKAIGAPPHSFNLELSVAANGLVEVRIGYYINLGQMADLVKQISEEFVLVRRNAPSLALATEENPRDEHLKEAR